MSATIFTFITHNQNYHHVCGVFGGLLAVITVQITVRLWQMNKEKNSTTELWLPIQRGFTFQSANRRDYSGTRRCKKRVRSLSYIHFWRQTHSTSGEWTEQVVDVEVVPLLILKHGWWWGQCLVERGISANQLEAFFLYRLMKIIVECCRMISWLDL